MMWRDQIEACTNAANMSAVWKYLKVSEKDTKIITSTDSESLVLHRMSSIRRGRVVVAGYCMMTEIAKWL